MYKHFEQDPKSEEKTCKNIAEMHPTDGFACSECGITIVDYVEERVDEDCHASYYEYAFKYCRIVGRELSSIRRYKMDKQIEEMTKDIEIAGKIATDWFMQETQKMLKEKGSFKSTQHTKSLAEISAEELVKMGYRKIPKDAVVLGKDFCDQREEMIVDLKYDKFELMNELSEKDNKIALLEETIECIKFNVDFTRKETADKFAKRLKESKTIKAIFGEGWMFSYIGVCKEIDEICKEITEGKDG